jgi:hypothetical protein
VGGCGSWCTKESRGRRYEVPILESGFSKTYNDQGLSVNQVRIRADRSLEKERERIVEHPFGTIKRAMEGVLSLQREGEGGGRVCVAISCLQHETGNQREFDGKKKPLPGYGIMG